MDVKKNADRFTGFAEMYENARPSLPPYAADMLRRYLGKQPGTVVDLGCGTGLSTLAWRGKCEGVVGVDPSGDMLRVAAGKETDGVRFVRAFAHDTGLDGGCADIVVCSQSFHWMEPVSTLREADRLLRPGGVFAAVDCDWPVAFNWRAEKAYMALYDKVRRLEEEVPEVRASFVRYPKDRHLQGIRESGHFAYCRELLFAHSETYTARRLVGLLYSQGSMQALLRRCPERIRPDMEAFEEQVHALLGGGTFPVDYSYRMRIGIKG